MDAQKAHAVSSGSTFGALGLLTVGPPGGLAHGGSGADGLVYLVLLVVWLWLMAKIGLSAAVVYKWALRPFRRTPEPLIALLTGCIAVMATIVPTMFAGRLCQSVYMMMVTFATALVFLWFLAPLAPGPRQAVAKAGVDSWPAGSGPVSDR